MTVNTAPVVVVSLVAGAPDVGADVAAAISACGVQFGNRVEVDLNRLAVTYPGLVGEVEAYLRCYRRFAEAASSGGRTGPWVATRRELGVWRENAGSKGGRVDLGDQYRALVDIVEIGDAVDAVLDPEPDLDLVAQTAQSVAVGDGEVTVTFEVPSVGVEWPVELGGAGWPTEVSRRFTLRCRYAASRQRRARRLAELSVEVCELWPDPAEFTADAFNT